MQQWRVRESHVRRLRTTLCKPCSQRQFRLHTPNFNGCTCKRDVCGRWTCLRCGSQRLINLWNAQAPLRHRLLHIHRRKKRNGRGYELVRGARRERPVCPIESCGRPPWLRHHSTWDFGQPSWIVEQWSHPDAWYLCLGCNNVRRD